MRIGVLLSKIGSNIHYRAAGPAMALERAGYEVEGVLPREHDHRMDLPRLRRCDVVHVFRYASKEIVAQVDDLQKHGVAIVWDNDDDIRLVPGQARGHTGYSQMQAEQEYRHQVKLLRRADLATTTTEVLAERWRAHGAETVMTIPNYLQPEQYAMPARRKDTIVIGWVAGLEHYVDDKALRITDTLRRVMARHANVRVVTGGVRLDLDPDRYEHLGATSLYDLPQTTRTFDIGIAPIADIPMNHARSDVKVKEYAAAGVPWLASARGSYAPLGAREGGMLVADDQWEQALETAVGSRLWRFRMGRRATAWGKDQCIDRHVGEWVAAFEQAVATAQERRRSERPGARRSA